MPDTHAPHRDRHTIVSDSSYFCHFALEMAEKDILVISNTRKYFYRSEILRDNHKKSLELCVFRDKVIFFHEN